VTPAERLRRVRALAVPRDGGGARRRRALRLAGLALVAGLAVVAARQVDAREVLRALAASDPTLLLLAGAANVLSLAAHSKRWAAVVRAPGVRVRFRDVFAATVAGFAVGVVVPARAGDVLRAYLLGRRTGLSTASVVAAAALDYVVGAATLVPLVALLAVATPLPAWARHALVVIGVAAALGVGAAWLLRPARGAGRPDGLVAHLRAGLAAAHEPGALAASCAWAVAGWTAELLIALLALAAVGLPVTVHGAALAVLASTAASAIAVSPGNTGPFELAVVLALAGLGAPRETALAFALLYHIAHLAPVAVLGAAVLLREARDAAEPVAP
jgi:glycosyltransferase AglD